MDRRLFLRAAGAAAATGVALTDAARAEEVISAERAVDMAQKAFPETVPGIFEFKVQSAGLFGRNVFLNSNAKWQDPGNLAVVLWPTAAMALAKRLGVRIDDLADAFEGRTVKVVGQAKRVWVAKPRSADLGPARKPYWATNIYLENPDLIGVIA